MKTRLLLTPVLALCGCSVMSFGDENFYSCAFEAEKASIAVENVQERLSRRSDYLAACMRAHGFQLKDGADKSKADAYTRVRWF
jgi:hypothetical protein